MLRLDDLCGSREDLIMQTAFYATDSDTVLEPNMFPYKTPPSIQHYTLWSQRNLTHNEVVAFVDAWLDARYPYVRRWQYDDNCGQRSIDLFHVHVYIEMKPFSFHIDRPETQYFPPHMQEASRRING